ncbi:MAG: tetratricopeptide repeat protein [Desulfovibrio sp.]|nr:tetratricopeptide repeat protein [Desulfovibrio sp.]
MRAAVNPGGPEDWPETSGISTAASSDAVPPAGRQASLPAGGESPDAGGGAVRDDVIGVPFSDKSGVKKEDEQATPRETIYVDEQGNPVSKPPEPDKMLADAKNLMGEQKIDGALSQLEKILAIPDISPEMREEVLYLVSDCQWGKYAENPLAGYEAIVSSTSEAMNANLRSRRVPDALLRLALANVNVGNLTDAGGYVVALYRRYPEYPGVAQGFAALGKEQLRQKLYPQAEQSFAVVLDRYPESSSLEAASLGLARSLFALKKYGQADVILEFMDKRWPRAYLADPDIVLLHAENAEKLGNLPAALDYYWLYVNLNPNRKENADLMLTVADIYFREGNTKAATFVYRETERRFAGSHAAAVARLRLAEKGIYDAPVTCQQMSRVFAGASDVSLWQVYSDLAGSSKTAPESVLARLKQAFWLYWNKDYTEAMGKAADFIDAYPDHSGVVQARDIIWQAFQKELASCLAEQNYDRILTLWNGFPLVRERYGPPDSRLRFALAQGWLRRGEDAKALDLLAEFLKSPMEPQYSEAAFMEFFNRYLKAGDWNGILDLGNLAANWRLNPQLRSQLDYAQALSAQNLNLAGPALAMWKKLAVKTDIPLYQRAYATFFLARDAERRKDIREAYERNKQVIELFTRLQDERSDKADPQRIKEAVSALMDICEVDNHIPEALDWLAEYNVFVSETSPEYPGLRFREARLYRKLGDATRARALLEDIAGRFPDSPFGKAASSELHTFGVSRDLQEYISGGGRAPDTP